MKKMNSQKGQALVLIALAAVGLFGFAALAIDGSRSYSDKRHAQNAADTAALSAALAYIKEPVEAQKWAAAKNAAYNVASSNGYDNDGTIIDLVPDTSAVIVEQCDATNISNRDCEGIAAGAESEYIRVYIVSHLSSTFSRVIGRQTVTNAAEAIVRVQGTSGSPGGSSSPFGDGALVATKTGNNNQCFLMNGGADLYTHDSGIFINCSGNQAIFMNGGADLQMDSNGKVVGCYAYNGNASFDPIDCNVAEQLLDGSYFASVPTTKAPPSCSGTGNVTGSKANTKMTGNSANVANNDVGTFSPGNFGSITVNSGATAIFTPGVYCVSGNFNLNGNARMQDSGGRVHFVLGQSINLNSGGIFDFSDLEIYSKDANFTMNGGAIFRADRLRLFFTGSGNFQVNGNAELTSTNMYAYLKGGNLTWNGNSILTLEAPPQDDEDGFGGLLLHKPWSNTSQVTLNGGSDIYLEGTFMVPHCPVTFNGGVDFELHSQIIGYEYIVNGNADVDIYFVPSENYQWPGGPAQDPSIELTK